MRKRIHLERLSLLEATALVEMANLGMADAEAWGDYECEAYEWTDHKAKAAGRAIEKLKVYRDRLQDREKLRD